MSDLTSKREELIQKIEVAFADVPYPGDDNIGIHLEGEAYVGKTDWRKIPLDFLLGYGTTLLDLTPEAVQFYLPAFMCATLHHPEVFHPSDVVIYRLTPNEYGFVEEMVPLFTTSQKSAVVEFLELYPVLFPYDAHALLEDSKAELQRAIHFWKTH